MNKQKTWYEKSRERLDAAHKKFREQNKNSVS